MTKAEHEKQSGEEVPYFQKLYDRPFLWLMLGLATMVAFYTAWGIVELVTLTKAPLP